MKCCRWIDHRKLASLSGPTPDGAMEEFAVRDGVRAKRSRAEPSLWFSRPFTIRMEKPIFDA
jgi:hypothetical protein